MKTKFLRPGHLVKWTFAKNSNSFNKKNFYYFGILLRPQKLPDESWLILLESGEIVHADMTEIDLI